MLESIKRDLRITSAAFNGEIDDLILAAKSDLKLAGIIQSKIDASDDALIKRAVTLYCKANFGLNNTDSEKYQNLYESLKTHLSMASDYNTEPVVTEGV